MNVNDQIVINYVKDKGDLVDLGSWNEYSGEYDDPYGDMEKHFKHCRPVDGDLSLVEESQAVFMGTFDEDNQKLLMEVHGVGCACGEYSNLGYVLSKSFSETVLGVLQENGVNVDVNVKRYSA